MIGGSFTTIDGGYASRIAALDEVIALRSTFLLRRGFNDTVRTIIKDSSTYLVIFCWWRIFYL